MDRTAPTIADACPLDAAAIAAVHRAAFPGPGEATLVEALHRAGAATISRCAWLDGQLVGHVLLSPVRFAANAGVMSGRADPRLLGLAPIAVLPALQRRGTGSALMHDALERARAVGADAVVLLGEPAYYVRFGFVPALRHGLHCRWPGTDEAFMVREVRAGALPAAGATLRRVDYHPVFDAL